MSNRAQRRAAKHKGKRQGETYADVLAKKRMIKEAIDRSVHDQSVAIEADVKSQRLIWMSTVALNRAFGFGEKRCADFFKALDEVAEEVEEMRKKHGGLYAKTKLMEAASKITKIEIQPVHEEEMREARIKNEKEGIFFPADDPDEW